MEILPIVRTYKIPILLGGISLLAIGVSIILLVKSTQTEANPIQFLPADEADSSGSAALTVDIEGAVVHPGVYTLSGGARVEDAITTAGGLASSVDTDVFAKTVNRAAKITDGAKLYIPTKSEDQTSHNLQSVVATSETSQNGLVSVNYASESELDALPGVGPVTAQKIIDNRPYQTLDEIVAKKAMGTALYEKLKNSLSL